MRPRIRSVFSDEKRFSIAALSHTLPDRLIKQGTPSPAIRRSNCSPLYWLPRSERWSTAWGLPRRRIVMTSASATRCAVMLLLIYQPTTRRENKSITTATKSQPSAVQTEVKSATHSWFCRVAANCGRDLPVEDVGRHRSWMLLAMVLRQTTPTGPYSKNLGAHQPFDLVQPAAQACCQHTVPDPHRAIGAVARQEPRPHLGSHLFIRHSTGAWGPFQPGMTARARDPQR